MTAKPERDAPISYVDPDLLIKGKFFECDNLIPEIGILAPCQLLSNNNRWLLKKTL